MLHDPGVVSPGGLSLMDAASKELEDVDGCAGAGAGSWAKHPPGEGSIRIRRMIRERIIGCLTAYTTWRGNIGVTGPSRSRLG